MDPVPTPAAPARCAPVRRARLGHAAFLLLAAIACLVLVGSPIFAWFPVVRLGAVLGALLLGALLVSAPWHWSDADRIRVLRWMPSTREFGTGVAVVGLLLFWIVITRFQSGEINAVDFTVYFDRPLFQTSRGQILYVETTDDARFEHLTHLGVHAYWILIPLAGLYWIAATPLWLLALTVVAVVAGAVHVFGILRQQRCSGIVAAAGAFAFVFNDNTARAVSYGFHAEILYAWFVPWAIDAGLRRARLSFAVAVLLCVLVKEDAIFPLFATSVVLALLCWGQLTKIERVAYLCAPSLVALANLLVYYLFVVPRLSSTGTVMYSYFWSTYGSTPWQVLAEMLTHPVRVIGAALTSGFFGVVLSRHAFLPLAGWRWLVGLAPLVAVYGVSDNTQLRGFGIYYAIAIVPFLAVATAIGARALGSRVVGWPGGELVAALLVTASALIGLGYSVRPWKGETAHVATALEMVPTDATVYVQSGLYPHAGYDARIRLLTRDPGEGVHAAGALALIAPNVSAFPLERAQVSCLAGLPALGSPPPGLMIVPLDRDARQCLGSSSKFCDTDPC